jgi:predicted N-acetyltransferase YhbS
VYWKWPIWEPEERENWSGIWGNADHLDGIAKYGFYEQAIGSAIFFTAHDEEGELVGYIIAMERTHHHVQKKMLYLDAVWVRKDYRGGELGKKLLAMAEDESKEQGLDFMMLGGPPKLMDHLLGAGWTLVEHIVVKKVDYDDKQA